MNTINLINGDCLDEMKKMEDKSIDVIFCDLPYGQTNCKWDTLIDLDGFWKEVMRIKKLHTPIIMTCTTKFGVSLITSAPKKCPFRYDLIWCKSASAGFLRAKKAPMRKHEMIYLFYEREPFYDISSHKHKFLGERETNQKNGEMYGRGNKKCIEGKYDPPLPHSLLEIKSTRGKHSTEKPVGLMEWILKYYSKVDDVIFDPTMGSGSMGVACKNMNRKFIGIEMDEEIFKVAEERLK